MAVGVVPLISQIAVLPEVSCQRMSLLPSPSKSRCPATDHVVATLETFAAEDTVPPFITQRAKSPDVSRQAMSLLPYP